MIAFPRMAKRHSNSRASGKVSAAPAPPPLWLRFRWQAAALAALVIAAYWNSLDGSFHFDDWSLLNDPFLQGGGFGWGVFRLMQTRPLTYWTFHLNFLAGTSTFGFHLLNTALHAANAILLLWILRRCMAGTRFEWPKSAKTSQAVPAAEQAGPAIAFLAAAIFAVHPLQTEAVSYIFQRASLLGTFFALLCFALFLSRRYCWSALAFAVSLAAKEETLALPAFVLLYDCLFNLGMRTTAGPDNAMRGEQSGKPGTMPVAAAAVMREEPVWKRILPRAWYYATLLGLDFLAVGRLFYVLGHTSQPGVGFAVKGLNAVTYALTQARVAWQYLRLILVPYGQNLDYDFKFSHSLLDPLTTLPAVVAILGLLGVLAWLSLRRSVPAFWALGFFILLSPSSSFVPQTDMIYEHRTYLPMACGAVVLAWLLWWALKRMPAAGTRAAVAAFVVCGCVGATVARNTVWQTELSLWSDVVSKSPNKARPYIGYSRALSQDNRPADALRAIERGVSLKPNDAELQMTAGAMRLSQGQPSTAYENFQNALMLGYKPSECWSNIGAALYQMQQTDRAMEAFRKALTFDPCFYNARRNLMMSLATEGRKQEALEAGTFPANCRLVPAQEQDIERYRAQIAQDQPNAAGAAAPGAR